MHYPLSIIAIEILAQCNLYCSFCVRNASHHDKSVFPLSLFEILLKQISALPTPPALAFTGGEPLMLNNLSDFCILASKNNLPFSITTNGTVHRWPLIQDIAQLPSFKHFIVSLDSANESIHNDIRKGKNSYQKTIEFMRQLKTQKIPFCTNMTVNESNFTTVEQTIQLALELGSKDISIASVKPNGRGESTLSKTQNQEIADQIIRNKFLISDEFKIWASEITFFLYDMEEYREMISNGTHNSCAFGKATLHIQVNGDILGCTSCNLVLGNINQTGQNYLGELWMNHKVLNEVRSKDHLKNECSGCEFKKFCGGCRCRAFSLKGDLFESDPYCPKVAS